MIPHEKALVERLMDEPFVLFGVNTDKDPARYRAQAESMGVTWPNLFQGGTDGPVPTKWGVSGYPTIYVVDAEGVIRYRDLRGEALEEAVLLLIAEAKGEAPPGGPDADGDGDAHDGGGHDHDGDHDDDGDDGDGGGDHDAVPATPLRPGR